MLAIHANPLADTCPIVKISIMQVLRMQIRAKNSVWLGCKWRSVCALAGSLAQDTPRRYNHIAVTCSITDYSVLYLSAGKICKICSVLPLKACVTIIMVLFSPRKIYCWIVATNFWFTIIVIFLNFSYKLNKGVTCKVKSAVVNTCV